MCSFPSSLSVSVFRISWNLENPNKFAWSTAPFIPQQGNLLSEGAEGVAEGFGSHAKQSLQEHVNLQGVKSLALV